MTSELSLPRLPAPKSVASEVHGPAPKPPIHSRPARVGESTEPPDTHDDRHYDPRRWDQSCVLHRAPKDVLERQFRVEHSNHSCRHG